MSTDFAAVAAAVREAEVRALREAAEAIGKSDHSCFRPQGCVECGRQKERDGTVRWLRDRADRIAALAPVDAPEVGGQGE